MNDITDLIGLIMNKLYPKIDYDVDLNNDETTLFFKNIRLTYSQYNFRRELNAVNDSEVSFICFEDNLVDTIKKYTNIDVKIICKFSYGKY
jgi:hypothetical protein